MEINGYDNLPKMILSSYRFDSTNVLKVFPIEIIDIIWDYLYTPIIEFEYSENTELECEKYHKGREYPYSIQSGTIPFTNESNLIKFYSLFI
jgi:hypothetical protein